MRRILFFTVAMFFSMATCSQTVSRQLSTGRNAFEVRQSFFFEDGRTLDEVMTTSWDPSYTFITEQALRSASNALLERVEFSYSEGRNLLLTKTTRDVESRLRNSVAFTYNPQGLVIRESLRDNRNREMSSYVFGYDNRGNLVSRILNNRTGSPMVETTFVYDNNRRVRSETRDMGGNLISATAFRYDTQGNLVGEDVSNSDRVITSRVAAEWRNGFEVERSTVGSDGVVRLLERNEYDDGLLRTKTIENRQGQSTQVIRFEYDIPVARR